MVDRTTDTTDVDYDLVSDLADDTVVPADGAGDVDAPDGTVNVNKTVPVEQPESKLSLRDQLSSAFKSPSGSEATTGEPKGGASTGAPSDPAQPAPPSLTQDAEGRWRKIDGTFASTEEIQAMQAAASADTAKLDEFMGTLPAKVAEQIKSLPAETQQFVARTMEDLNSRAQRYSEYDQLEQVLGPRRSLWAEQGMNPLVAINQLLALSDFAGNNPSEFVLWFADQNGIDLDAALDARDAAQGQVSPEVRELRGQVQQLSQTLQQMQQGSQSQQQDPNLLAVQNFATEKDEGGNLKRPYLSEVMPVFATQVAAIRQANPTLPNEHVLAKAYEAACWAEPNVRIKLQQEMDNQRREAARQKLAQKKTASSSIRGGPSGGPGAMPGQSLGNGSLRETLQAAFAAHGS